MLASPDLRARRAGRARASLRTERRRDERLGPGAQRRETRDTWEKRFESSEQGVTAGAGGAVAI